MTKEMIFNDFLKLKEEGVLDEKFSTYDELLAVLSEMFQDKYSKYPDAQEAFDDLDDDLNGLLTKNCGVYSLGTKEWEIKIEQMNEKTKEKHIKDWNEYYGSEIKDLDDLADSITHRVMKDMSNAGCDVYNALAMIIDDVFGETNLIYVDLGEENPRIEFLL